MEDFIDENFSELVTSFWFKTFEATKEDNSTYSLSTVRLILWEQCSDSLFRDTLSIIGNIRIDLDRDLKNES